MINGGIARTFFNFCDIFLKILAVIFKHDFLRIALFHDVPSGNNINCINRTHKERGTRNFVVPSASNIDDSMQQYASFAAIPDGFRLLHHNSKSFRLAMSSIRGA